MLNVGARNLFDKNPPIPGTYQQSSDNTIPATGDIQGRVFYVGVNARF